jgi:hypothetical protein
MNWNYLWILVGVVVVAYVALFLAEWVRPQEPERPTPVLDPRWAEILQELREELGRDPTMTEWIDRKVDDDERRYSE